MDDERTFFNSHTAVEREDGVVEIVHIRAVEYVCMASGEDMVGIRITHGDGEKQYVDVRRNRFIGLGLEKLICGAIETREELIKKLEEEKS